MVSKLGNCFKEHIVWSRGREQRDAHFLLLPGTYPLVRLKLRRNLCFRRSDTHCLQWYRHFNAHSTHSPPPVCTDVIILYRCLCIHHVVEVIHVHTHMYIDSSRAFLVGKHSHDHAQALWFLQCIFKMFHF